MYYTYGAKGPSPDIARASLEEMGATRGSLDLRTPMGGGGTVTVRDGLNYGDYQFFRPSESMPRRQKEVIAACDEAYRKVGLLRNIIDLMSDFASQGLDIFHPNKKKQKRYRAWFSKVRAKERSERFLNLLYRHGNVVLKRAYADLNVGDLLDLERGVAARPPDTPEDKTYERGPKVYRNRIPIQYTFMNPTAVEVIGGDLALFAGSPTYALKLPEALFRVIKNPKTPEDVALIASLPPYILNPIRANKKLIPLDTEKVDVYHYKKDDWQHWADPMIYSILSDIKLYEKNKLADMAALDGAVSHIRLWRIGSLEHKIQPGPAAFARLREQLAMATGGGPLDLVWDATLDLKESTTDIYNFLGSKKYEPVLQAIYAGLGIPQGLTGAKTSEGGMSQNAMSLKTLIERLQYGRDLLQKMWDKELAILQEAFGDSEPAQIHFENMSLSDESNEKMLWLHLFDRDIISLDTIREKFGTIPEVETARIRSDYKARKDKTVPDKAGPYVDAQPDLSLEKIALQTGVVSPEQVGLTLEDKKGDRLFDLQKKQIELDSKKITNGNPPPITKQKKKGTPGQGRPKNSNDQQKRKPRVDKPRTARASFARTHSWARQAQRMIADIVTPLYLERCKKNNMRGLSVAQSENLEEIKFNILCSLSPNSKVDAEGIISVYDTPPATPPFVKQLLDDFGTATQVEELREFQAMAYTMWVERQGGEDGEIDDQS